MPISWYKYFIMQILHCADAVYHLVCFWSDWYWLFLPMFSVPFRSSCKAGLMVMKSLSTCLFAKNFIFSSLMKLSLAGYEILGWKFFSLRMSNIGPSLFWLVGFLPRNLLWVSWASLCGWPDLSLWLPLVFSPLFQPWWIWRLCALGLLFLWSIFVVFSVFPWFECWPAC